MKSRVEQKYIWGYQFRESFMAHCDFNNYCHVRVCALRVFATITSNHVVTGLFGVVYRLKNGTDHVLFVYLLYSFCSWLMLIFCIYAIR